MLVGDDRTRVRLAAQALPAAARRSRPAGDARCAPRLRAALRDPALIAELAAAKALTSARRRPAPAGVDAVVVGGGFGGVLFHEMTGHGLEADHIQKQRRASTWASSGTAWPEPLLTAFDDGRMPGEWGPTRSTTRERRPQKTPVIEEGGSSPLYYRIRAEAHDLLPGRKVSGQWRVPAVAVRD